MTNRKKNTNIYNSESSSTTSEIKYGDEQDEYILTAIGISRVETSPLLVHALLDQFKKRRNFFFRRGPFMIVRFEVAWPRPPRSGELLEIQ
jgi:hypothetical protein